MGCIVDLRVEGAVAAVGVDRRMPWLYVDL
jgi:hypothetical protein